MRLLEFNTSEASFFLKFGRTPSLEVVEYTLRYSTASRLGSLPSGLGMRLGAAHGLPAVGPLQAACAGGSE